MRVESILFHAATRSRNVKNIPNAIPLGKELPRVSLPLNPGYTAAILLIRGHNRFAVVP